MTTRVFSRVLAAMYPNAPTFLLLSVCLCAAGQANAQAPSAASWPVPPVGQVCTAQAADMGGVPSPVTSTFSGLVEGKYCFQTQSQKNGVRRTCLNSEGNPVELNGYARTPHSGFFSWPLTVGKEWEFTYSATGTSGGTFTWLKHVKVVGYENVVAGGQQYAAFKIEATNRNQAGGYTVAETAYYAPSIGKIVKYDGGRDFGTVELVSCSPVR